MESGNECLKQESYSLLNCPAVKFCAINTNDVTKCDDDCADEKNVKRGQFSIDMTSTFNNVNEVNKSTYNFVIENSSNVDKDEANSGSADRGECEFVDGYSSSSTAGPPPNSPENTGRFDKSPWNFALAHMTSSHGSSMSSSCATRTDLSRETGRYSIPANDGSHTTHFTRQNAIQYANQTSFMGTSPISSIAPREWGRSFRLFNNHRFNSQMSISRIRESGSSSLRNRSIIFRSFNNRLNAGSLDAERSMFMSNSLSYLRQSGVASSHNASIHLLSRSPEIRGASVSATVTRNTTPLPVSSCSSHYPSSPLTTSPHPYSFGTTFALSGANLYALNASSLIHGLLSGSSVGNLTAAQKELPLLFNALRSHLSINGTNIIVGDQTHALEIRRGNLIGAGGYAKVYVGLNTVTGELMAVKEIDIKDVDEIAALDAIEEEFGLIKSIRHPNIVSYHLFEHSKSQKVCRIVMELLAGDSTLKMLQKCGPLTETVLRKITRHLLNALTFIHKSGIFHRDVKPANILVSHRGEVKLCDFGCSKRLSELNKASNYIIGTPVYMAPELIKGDADHKADIWSMACSLFELATGRLPWYHSNVKDNLSLMFYITTTSETPLAANYEDKMNTFSPDFVDFMEKCFERNVNKRPEAEELLHHPWITTTSHTFFTSPELSLERTTEFVRSSPLESAHTSSCANSCSSLETTSKTLLEVKLNKNNEELEIREFTIDTKSEPNGVKMLPSETSTQVMVESVISDVNSTSVVNECAVDDEVLCQLELEEVSAVVAVDLCKYLMNATDMVYAINPEPTSMENNPVYLDGIRGISSPEAVLSISHSLNPKWYTSVLSVGELSSLTMSPEHSLLYENVIEEFQKSMSQSDASSQEANVPSNTTSPHTCLSNCHFECDASDEDNNNNNSNNLNDNNNNNNNTDNKSDNKSNDSRKNSSNIHLHPLKLQTIEHSCSLAEEKEHLNKELQISEMKEKKCTAVPLRDNSNNEVSESRFAMQRKHIREVVFAAADDEDNDDDGDDDDDDVTNQESVAKLPKVGNEIHSRRIVPSINDTNNNNNNTNSLRTCEKKDREVYSGADCNHNDSRTDESRPHNNNEEYLKIVSIWEKENAKYCESHLLCGTSKHQQNNESKEIKKLAPEYEHNEEMEKETENKNCNYSHEQSEKEWECLEREYEEREHHCEDVCKNKFNSEFLLMKLEKEKMPGRFSRKAAENLLEFNQEQLDKQNKCQVSNSTYERENHNYFDKYNEQCQEISNISSCKLKSTIREIDENNVVEEKNSTIIGVLSKVKESSHIKSSTNETTSSGKNTLQSSCEKHELEHQTRSVSYITDVENTTISSEKYKEPLLPILHNTSILHKPKRIEIRCSEEASVNTLPFCCGVCKVNISDRINNPCTTQSNKYEQCKYAKSLIRQANEPWTEMCEIEECGKEEYLHKEENYEHYHEESMFSLTLKQQEEQQREK